MSMFEAEVAIIGAGMAGVSLGAAIAPRRRTVVIEAEDHPGRHATGRSAAMYFEPYGAPVVRALTRASRAFLFDPPPGFAEAALVRPRGVLMINDSAGADAFEARMAQEQALRTISLDEACARVPILRRDWLGGAAFSERGYDIDVAALLQGFLKTAKRAGAQFVFGANALAISRANQRWVLRAGDHLISASVLVNAAGAWADAIALSCGASARGLSPLRRSASLSPPPSLDGFQDWPLVIDATETLYFKPEGAQLLVSPANEDPSVACDAAPEDIDIAIAVDRFENATSHRIARVAHRWAGLRTFAPDRLPVVGFDPVLENFFWLAGQGGYGIQMAEALSRVAAALILNESVGDDIQEEGIDITELRPDRLPALDALSVA